MKKANLLVIFVFVVSFGLFAGETTNSVNDVAETEARIKELRSQLKAAPLPEKFEDYVAAAAAIKKRKTILEELYLLTDENDIDSEHELAELYVEAIRHFTAIRKSLEQVEKTLDENRMKRVSDEKELKEIFEKLDGLDTHLVMAQHEIDELPLLDSSDIPPHHADILKTEINKLGRETRDSGSKTEKLKEKLLIDFVKNRAVELTGGWKHTEKLAKLEKQGRILSLYVNQIADPAAANEVLKLQLEILKKSRQIEKDRLKDYQKKALELFDKAIKAWSSKQGDWSVRIIEDLSKIDRSALVFEMEEIYRGLWDCAMNEYDKRVQNEQQFKEKARFLLRLSEREKLKLESL